jgi:hypothetical protein
MKTRKKIMVVRSRVLWVVLVSLVVCNCASAWTTPVPLSEVNTQYADLWPTISSDGLTLYFTRGENPAHYWNQPYRATRSTPSGPFSNVTRISELTYGDHVNDCWVSPDNLRMYYGITAGGWQIGKSTRATDSSLWGPYQNITELNYLKPLMDAKLSADELSIVFTVYGSTTAMYTASRSNISSPFTTIRALSELNTSSPLVSCLGDNGLTLYFNRYDNGVWHNYQSTRPSINGIFDAPQLLNFPDNYRLNSFSSDGQTAYLFRNDNGDANIYVSQIPEPATLLLLGLGAVMLRRHRNQNINTLNNFFD